MGGGIGSVKISIIKLGSIQVLHYQVRGAGSLNQNDDIDDASRGIGGLGLK